MKEQMKALVSHGDGSISLEDRTVPVLLEDTDAIVRVTLSTICMSDLHIMRGAVPRAVPETVLGHEFVGEIVSVGSSVQNFRPGDRVAANCITFCGDCYYCRKGFINNCEKGGWELGCRIDGCQAEYVRVPFAQQGLTKIPDSVTDENALFVGDILSSGYFGAELCEISPGDTVAVIGAGPVGLCSMLCARLFGAARIIALDIDLDRLSFAKEQGLADIALSPEEAGWEDVLAEATHGRGADGVIEAAGGQNTFALAFKIARANSVVALLAMYEENQIFPLPSMYGKNLIFKTGGVDAVHCERLLELISLGKINTDFLITHKAPLNDILKGYEVFGERKDHCYKWAVTPYEEQL
jgi:alcohol dehydrogenase